MVEGSCPKCGRPGTQSLYRKKTGGHDPRSAYLQYHHKNPNTVCYIGRVRSTTEAMSEFDEPEEQQYKEILDGVIKDIKNLVNGFSPNTSIRQKALSSRLEDIFRKYGY